MSKSYLVGPPGAGKTSRLVDRLVQLLEQNTRPDRILVLVPQQSQARVFRAALARVAGANRPRGEPDIDTIYSLAQNHVSLFFPLIAPMAGFANPAQEPMTINTEAAQYFVGRLVQPRIEDFSDLKLQWPRLLRQILDNLNKAAVCGFPIDQIAERLGSAWAGDPQRLVSYQRAQEVALDFRQFCLENSLLDFSLLMQLFAQYLLPAASYHDYVAARYRHVLADNLEEYPPVAHDFLRLLLQTCDTALLAEDDPGGFRLFLGADVESARALRTQCDEVVRADEVFIAPPALVAFGQALMLQFRQDGVRDANPRPQPESPVTNHQSPVTDHQLPAALGDRPGAAKYWTEMVDWVVERIRRLLAEGVAPADIAVVAPFVEDVLRFELEERLRPAEVGVWSVRPSRPLYDHPAVRALLVLARLSNPHWQLPVSTGELARALASIIADLDVARAQLIADAALRISTINLPPIEDTAVWERVGERFQEPYAALQRWMASHMGQPGGQQLATEIPLDVYWQQLLAEVLAQPGFEPSTSRDNSFAIDKLIRGARAFREVMDRVGQSAAVYPVAGGEHGVPGIAQKPRNLAAPDVGLEYVTLLTQGLWGAQYAPEREQPPAAAMDNADAANTPPVPGSKDILIAPIYTYLTSNFRSRYQFWLDINSLGWYERIYQPLTHPYVLSRQWKPGTVWMEADEHRERQAMLSRLVGGLVYRCSGQVFMASSQLGISGQEESGPLERAVRRLIWN